MSNIKALKLGTGEELVVEIVTETETTIEFKNPVACVMQRSEKGPMLGFMPWMQAADGPFTINRDKIVIIAEVADEVKNGYNQIFGAGIVVPAKQLITG
jgi:hypothetical protein